MSASAAVKKIKQGHLTFYFGVDQGTQEWLELRSELITCSNSLVACSKGPKYSREVNRQHAKRTTPNGNHFTERGHILEDEVREMLEREFNNDQFELMSCSFITNDNYPGAGYSPDGIIMDRKTKQFITPVEIKCFNDYTEYYSKKEHKVLKEYKGKHKNCCEDVMNVPLENRMQFEMEMLITDTDKVLVVLYNPEAEVDKGVPVLKIHQYEPEKFVEDGKEVYAYRETLKEQLLQGE